MSNKLLLEASGAEGAEKTTVEPPEEVVQYHRVEKEGRNRL
jgi:hypothetical protein